MNIWIEGAPGTGTTLLAKALGGALDVEPLEYATHADLRPNQQYNVIAKHPAITDTVLKKALPERFKGLTLLQGGCESIDGADDLCILLRFNESVHKHDDYEPSELDRIDHHYRRVFCELTSKLSISFGCRGLLIEDFATNPNSVRGIHLFDPGVFSNEQARLEAIVFEILRIIRDIESLRLAPAHKSISCVEVIKHIPTLGAAHDLHQKGNVQK